MSAAPIVPSSASAAIAVSPPLGSPDPRAFVHLHAHSEFSILDGLNGVYTLVRTAGNLGQPAIALTDHGRLSGSINFWDAIGWYNSSHAERHSEAQCKPKNCHSAEYCATGERCPRVGVPGGVHDSLPPLVGILGLETYVADKGRGERTPGDWGHLVLLALSNQGWDNLRVLASRADLEGFYSKPRIDMAMLAEHSGGLAALSACLGGHLARKLRDEGEAAADALIVQYVEIFGARYYLEVQWHNDQDVNCAGCAAAAADHRCSREQYDLNRYLVRAGERLGVPLILTNDLHYARREDAVLEEIVLANQQNLTLAQLAAAKAAGKKGMLSFDTPDFYIKTRREMSAALANWLRAARADDPATALIIERDGRRWIERSVELAALATTNAPFPDSSPKFPLFPLADGQTADEGLAEHVWAKAARRYPNMSEVTRRLIAYELQCVQELGFSAYFLITEDFVDYARAEGIAVGLGRGSAPGSVISYALGITGADPIHYKLTVGNIGLTRFLNPTVHYFARPDDFGGLSAAALTLPAPSLTEMTAELAALIKAAVRTRGEALANGRGVDIVSGEPFSPERNTFELERYKRYIELLGREWEQLKAQTIDATASPDNERSYAKAYVPDRLPLVEFLWRAVRDRAAGAGRGTRNELHSHLAVILGLTSTRPATIGDEVPLLPHYKFDHSRIGMPDIDIDFTPGHDGREKVMRYVVDKYGADHVCQIATFGKLLAKSAIKDVARAKGLPPDEGQRLADLIPKKFAAQADDAGGEEIPGVTLREMLTSEHPAVVEGSRELRAAMTADPLVDEVLRLAARIEGMIRSESTHACGVLITPAPVLDYVSVKHVDSGTGRQAVHDGPTLTDKIGLLKVDFLGLKNLRVNELCTAFIAERHGESVDWQTLPDDDPAAMKLLRDGFTNGIFQFASTFATGILRQIKPKTVQDLMVATALGRPGPMEYIPNYVEARARGVVYGDPVFERYASPILDETYGVLVYQEQVMLLAIALSDFSLPQSDGLRKATAKKDLDKLRSFREQFVNNAIRKGVAADYITRYWDDVLIPFASYSFNKSHSTAYALTAYKQAYLKAHYLPEFLAALMTVDQSEQAKVRGNASPLALEVAEARRLGLRILAIDINRSTARVEIEPDAEAASGVSLRISLEAAKGIGEKPIAAILSERTAGGPFLSFPDFMARTVEQERLPDPETGKKAPNPVNKTIVMTLAKIGAFDAFDDRNALLARLEAYYGTTSAKKRAAIEWTDSGFRYPAPPRDYFEWERELLGFFCSAHPADSIPADALAKTTGSLSEVLTYDRVNDPETRVIVGLPQGLSYFQFKSGKGAAIKGKLADSLDTVSFMYFEPRSGDGLRVQEEFTALRELIEAGGLDGDAVLLAGKAKHSERSGEGEFMVERRCLHPDHRHEGTTRDARGREATCPEAWAWKRVALPRLLIVETPVSPKESSGPSAVEQALLGSPTSAAVADGLEALFE